MSLYPTSKPYLYDGTYFYNVYLFRPNPMLYLCYASNTHMSMHFSFTYLSVMVGLVWIRR